MPELKILPQYLMRSMEAGVQPPEAGRMMQWVDPTFMVGKLVRSFGPTRTIIANESAGNTVINVERFDRPTGTPALIYGDLNGNIKVVLSLEDQGCPGAFPSSDLSDYFSNTTRPETFDDDNDDIPDFPDGSGTVY